MSAHSSHSLTDFLNSEGWGRIERGHPLTRIGNILHVGNGVAEGCLAHLSDRTNPRGLVCPPKTKTTSDWCIDRDPPSLGANSKDVRSLPIFCVDAVPRREGHQEGGIMSFKAIRFSFLCTFRFFFLSFKTG